jgi:hypothetical protein
VNSILQLSLEYSDKYPDYLNDKHMPIIALTFWRKYLRKFMILRIIPIPRYMNDWFNF